MQPCADGRQRVIIRGLTIDPLVRSFEGLFNTGALDTVEGREKEERGREAEDRERN